MTTDEKTDAKSSESEPNATTSIQTDPQNDTQKVDDSECTADKLVDTTTQHDVIQQSIDANVDDGKSLNQEDDNKTVTDCNESQLREAATVASDVEMKNAESVENISSASTSMQEDSNPGECVAFKVVYNKNVYDLEFPLDQTVAKLKERIQTLTSVAPTMQKLVFRGILNDAKTLRETGIKNGAKVMLIGSTITDIIAVNLTTKDDAKEEKLNASVKEPLCRQKQHKKILDKGKPSDAMAAWKNGTAPLPAEPLHGMLNKYGNKVRLTFKLEQDQLWVGTKERTEKLSMMSVRSIISEPIEGHEEYHLMAIQTGPTEASRIWIYWVPAQFVEAIKDTILGK